jgi:Fe2+ transport system protein FeoA
MRIRELNSEPTVCIRLRELGFCENAVVRCLTRDASKLICEICNTRVGLQAAVADTILIAPLD